MAGFVFTLRRPQKDQKFKVYDLVLGASPYGTGAVVGQMWRQGRGGMWVGFDHLSNSHIMPRSSFADCRRDLETVVSLSIRLAAAQFTEADRQGLHASGRPIRNPEKAVRGEG